VRVQRLDLFAFGPFTNGKLDFSKKPAALQLIYGPNEAGKSTTLRALLALLYGIPLRTSDAHLHDMARLRIGATLLDERGRSLTVVRRKGAKQTLLDAEGQPLHESALSEMLAGIDEGLFRNMFALDHQRLREGAEVLLAGGGQLGEGLFDASVGSLTLREVKEALRLEAEELFKARGKTPKLNQALEALREQARKKRESALSPSVFADQTRAIEQARRRRDVALGQRRELLTEQARLSRTLEIVPLLSRYDAVLAELAALPTRAPAELGARTLGDGSRAPARAVAEGLRAPARAATDGLHATAPEVLGEVTRELERRYGVVLSAQAELPALRAECALLEHELEAVRERLGAAAHSARPLDTPQRARLRRQWEEQGELARRERELDEQKLAAQEQLHSCEEGVLALEQSLGDGRLEALLVELERGDLAGGLARGESELRAKLAQLEHGLAQLRLAFDAEALARLVLPDQATLVELERGLADQQRAAHEAQERRAQLDRKLGESRSRADELLEQGQLATLAELEAARAAREQAFAGLFDARPAQTPPGALPAEAAISGYRAAVAHADQLADRLRREAAQRHELTRLQAEAAQLEQERAALAHACAEIEARRVALAAELSALLAPAGLAHEGLRGLRAKLLKLEQLRELAGEIGARNAAQAAQAAQAAHWAARLAPLLAAPAGSSLSELVVDARARRAADQARARELEGLKARAAEAGARLRALSTQLTACAEQRAQSAREFAAELERAGFDARLSPPELLACLDDMSLLFEGTRKLVALCARIDSHQAQAELLRGELAAVVARHVPAAAGLALGEQLEALAGVEREQRESQRDKQRLSLDKQRLELDLARLGDGRDLATLRQGVSQLDPDALRARLIEIEGAIGALDDEIGALDQEIGRLEAGMARLTEAPYAVSIAEEVEAELVNVRTLLRRYLEVKLSLALIAREVEKHRRAHQAPLLARASALFARLTLERYSGLSVELDERDQPLLCAVHSGGKQVRIGGLSDGTRDQLYLALRLASIERFLGRGSALPLVLDDAFIHFDDARAQAALLALAELAQRSQVLFFTHHARMVELAKRALPATQVALHELDALRGTVAFRDNGPLFAGA
jgi:uncharacterized protein YhaN